MLDILGAAAYTLLFLTWCAISFALVVFWLGQSATRRQVTFRLLGITAAAAPFTLLIAALTP